MSDTVNISDNTLALTNVLNTRNFYGNSSYSVMDSTWKYVYDRYNDNYVWIPLNGDIAGLCAKTIADKEIWFSPAGLNRGKIKNVVKFSLTQNRDFRDELYKKGINPVVIFPNDGAVLFGDKTLQTKASAFDRINVRMLFIYLEKSIALAARYQLFELNNEYTRTNFVGTIRPFLATIKGKEGITEFYIVCDKTNNTPEIIDTNQFVGDIYIQPARSINFINLSFTATRTGIDFNTIIINNSETVTRTFTAAL